MSLVIYSEVPESRSYYSLKEALPIVEVKEEEDLGLTDEVAIGIS